MDIPPLIYSISPDISPHRHTRIRRNSIEIGRELVVNLMNRFQEIEEKDVIIHDNDIIILPANNNNDNSCECCICFDKIESHNGGNLLCGHIYHNKCIKKWFNKHITCPICRNEEDPKRYLVKLE